MTARLHAPHQTTSGDPARAVDVLEAHLGERLATWQVFALVALLTPREAWGSHDAAVLVATPPEPRMTRGTCPRCREVRHVRVDGMLRTHRTTNGGLCAGSGRPPAARE